MNCSKPENRIIPRIGYRRAFTISFSAWWRGAKGQRLSELTNPFFWHDFLKHVVPQIKKVLGKNIPGLTLRLNKISFSMDSKNQTYDQTIITEDKPGRVIECCPRCRNVHHNVPEDLLWCDCSDVKVNYKNWKKYIASLQKSWYEKYRVHKE